MKTIFDINETGVTTFEENSEGGFSLTKHQDVEPILEQNKIEYNKGLNNNTNGPIGRKVASIPLVVWSNWMKETNGEVQKNPKLLAKYLNSSENKYFRTHNSRV